MDWVERRKGGAVKDARSPLNVARDWRLLVVGTGDLIWIERRPDLDEREERALLLRSKLLGIALRHT